VLELAASPYIGNGEGARGEAKGLTPAKQKEKITELYTLYKVLDRRTLYRLTVEL
jgi:hypothetical protein